MILIAKRTNTRSFAAAAFVAALLSSLSLSLCSTRSMHAHRHERSRTQVGNGVIHACIEVGCARGSAHRRKRNIRSYSVGAGSTAREGEALLVVGSFSAAGFQSAGEETILKMATSMRSVDRGRPLSIGYTRRGLYESVAWRRRNRGLEALCRAIIYCCIVSRMCSYPSGGPTFTWRPCLHLNCVLPLPPLSSLLPPR